jgi:hypothetical protein
MPRWGNIPQAFSPSQFSSLILTDVSEIARKMAMLESHHLIEQSYEVTFAQAIGDFGTHLYIAPSPHQSSFSIQTQITPNSRHFKL